jgi:disulfide bond formation protein DsbB
MFADLIHARPRLVLLALGVFCFVSVGAAALLGHLLDLEVCAMCWFQRLAFLLAGAGFVLAAAWPRAGFLTQRLGELGLLLGLASAARQSWLLLNPEAASGSCGAGLMYYLQIGNYEAFMRAGMLGGVECAENQPLILGLHLPQWSLLAFCVIGVLYVAWMFRKAPLARKP